MYSTLAKQLFRKSIQTNLENFRNFHFQIKQKREAYFRYLNYNTVNKFYWIKEEDSTKKIIGVDTDIVSVLEGVDSVIVPNNTIIKKDQIMFTLVSDNLPQDIYAPFDLEIEEVNNDIMNFINIRPEDKKKSWIIKVSNLNYDDKSLFTLSNI